MSNPFFSVIVPVHNGEEYMRNGLESIIMQSFDNYELIIVCDDCSDNSEKIAREYTDKVIRTNYGRAGLARNAGIDAATGEWILFMDDDDWWLHEFAFEVIAGKVSDPMFESVLAFGFVWKGVGYRANQPGRVYPAPWNKAYRRDVLSNLRFPDKKIGEDVPFTNAIMCRPEKVLFWDMPLYYYNYGRKGSLTWRAKNE